jgi:pimeloyl-ACP methyl ester carboxylesterase
MPWSQHYLSLDVQGHLVDMAYMDVKPERPNGQVLLLLHGKNFNGWYWKGVVSWAQQQGYRIIVPDQLGFGNSDYPDIHYSFHLLASNTRQILDHLGIEKVTVIGHSMGGMLATRFALMYPQMTERLVLENPIGLEDYRTIVPYTSIEEQYRKELSATYASYQNYQKSYYPQWKPEYDSLVMIQAAALSQPDFRTNIARANALTYDMIYQQPVCYEFSRLSMPVLLIIGSEDRTIVGKALLSDADKKRYGQYPELGRRTTAAIRGAQLRELPGVGHIPHIQSAELFLAALSTFLNHR